MRSDIVDVEGRANETVDGRDNPGKEESRIFTGWDAIFVGIKSSFLRITVV